MTEIGKSIGEFFREIGQVGGRLPTRLRQLIFLAMISYGFGVYLLAGGRVPIEEMSRMAIFRWAFGTIIGILFLGRITRGYRGWLIVFGIAVAGGSVYLIAKAVVEDNANMIGGAGLLSVAGLFVFAILTFPLILGLGGASRLVSWPWRKS